MFRRSAAIVVALSLLLQGMAPVWAETARAETAVAANTEQASVLPCHGAQAEQAVQPAASMPAMDCCNAGVDCGNCAVGCMAAPALPATIASSPDDPAAQDAARLAAATAPAIPPADLLRPPISILH